MKPACCCFLVFIVFTPPSCCRCGTARYCSLTYNQLSTHFLCCQSIPCFINLQSLYRLRRPVALSSWPSPLCLCRCLDGCSCGRCSRGQGQWQQGASVWMAVPVVGAGDKGSWASVQRRTGQERQGIGAASEGRTYDACTLHLRPDGSVPTALSRPVPCIPAGCHGLTAGCGL